MRAQIEGENQLVHAEETTQQKAIRLLNRQLEELQTIRALNDSDNPKFKSWQDTTWSVFERFLGKENPHSSRFSNITFFSMVYEYKHVGRCSTTGLCVA